MGRAVNAVTTDDATMLILAFAPGRRGPIPRGLDRAEIETAYPGWAITDEEVQDARLPWFLERLHADPRWYRLRRTDPVRI